MNHETVRSALKTLNVPVSFHTYKGRENTYIIYSQYDEVTALNTNDEESAVHRYYQVDIHSNKDYFDLAKQVKQALTSLGGVRMNEADLSDGEHYQRSMRFRFSITKYEEEF